MASDTGEGTWYEGDHVQGGFAVLERLGYPRLWTQTASAGSTEHGIPQILVLGYSNVELLTSEGDLLLDVGSREVRAVRLVRGAGVQLCVTPRGESGLRQTRWMHRVSDADAQFLEQCWLNASPTTHFGTQLNYLPWREDEYAYLVGRVVTGAARADIALSALVVAARHLLGQSGVSVHGASGEKLACALDELGTLSAAIGDIGERYRAWYKWRNFSAHGIRGRDAAGHPTDQVFKPKKARKGMVLTPEDAFDIEVQDLNDLALLCRAFHALSQDAFRTTVYVGGPGTPQEVLAHLPMSDTVSAAERLPPGHRHQVS